MTLEQAIEHCEEKVKELKATAKLGRGNPNPFAMLPEECLSCAEEHEQLAGWLKELKKRRANDRPQGEWIREDKPWGGFGDRVLVLTCSKCGESFVYHGNEPKFCSECGADMRGEENG